MRKAVGALAGLIVLLLALYSCGGSGGDGATTAGTTSNTGTGTGTGVETAPAATAVKMKADFSAIGEAPSFSFFRAAPPARLTACPTPTPSEDEPRFSAGLDCDQDGGEVSFLTPTSFKVALKRLSFIRDDDTRVDFIPDRGTLANSLVFDLTSLVTVSQVAVPAGTYTAVEAEIYYYEIRMPLNNPPLDRNIRVYLSDDDFPGEGNLGHHQGDITFIDDTGQELGWVDVATIWTTTALQTDKATVTRPGGMDAESGHQRGMFGDSNLWNQSEFMQGANQDIFLISRPFGPNGLTVAADQANTVSLVFNVKDSWFWEDFDHDGTFNPCENGTKDACDASAAWAPLFKLPVLTVQ